MLDDTLIGIENLNSGYLTHHIFDPQVLSKYLETIKDDLEETAPECKVQPRYALLGYPFCNTAAHT